MDTRIARLRTAVELHQTAARERAARCRPVLSMARQVKQMQEQGALRDEEQAAAWKAHQEAEERMRAKAAAQETAAEMERRRIAPLLSCALRFRRAREGNEQMKDQEKADARLEGVSVFGLLPWEILVFIFSQLPPKLLAKLECASCQLYTCRRDAITCTEETARRFVMGFDGINCGKTWKHSLWLYQIMYEQICRSRVTVGPNSVSAKLVLLGGSMSGKSNVAVSGVYGHAALQQGLINAAFMTKSCQLGEGEPDDMLKFEIWDTACQERYHSLAPMYYRGAAVALVFYSRNCRDDFRMAQRWIMELRRNLCRRTVIILVATVRPGHATCVTMAEAELFATEQGVTALEVRLSDEQDAQHLFQVAAKKMSDLLKEEGFSPQSLKSCVNASARDGEYYNPILFHQLMCSHLEGRENKAAVVFRSVLIDEPDGENGLLSDMRGFFSKLLDFCLPV